MPWAQGAADTSGRRAVCSPSRSRLERPHLQLPRIFSFKGPLNAYTQYGWNIGIVLLSQMVRQRQHIVTHRAIAGISHSSFGIKHWCVPSARAADTGIGGYRDTPLIASGGKGCDISSGRPENGQDIPTVARRGAIADPRFPGRPAASSTSAGGALPQTRRTRGRSGPTPPSGRRRCPSDRSRRRIHGPIP